jgi:hypothetical protein
MKEGVLDVELADAPLEGERDGEDDADRSRFYNRTEGLVEVDAGSLGEATKNPTCLVPIKGDVGVELVAKKPFCR